MKTLILLVTVFCFSVLSGTSHGFSTEYPSLQPGLEERPGVTQGVNQVGLFEPCQPRCEEMAADFFGADKEEDRRADLSSAEIFLQTEKSTVIVGITYKF